MLGLLLPTRPPPELRTQEATQQKATLENKNEERDVDND